MPYVKPVFDAWPVVTHVLLDTGMSVSCKAINLDIVVVHECEGPLQT